MFPASSWNFGTYGDNENESDLPTIELKPFFTMLHNIPPCPKCSHIHSNYYPCFNIGNNSFTSMIKQAENSGVIELPISEPVAQETQTSTSTMEEYMSRNKTYHDGQRQGQHGRSIYKRKNTNT